MLNFGHGWAGVSFASKCFPASALVRTPAGWQQISTLNPGDEVIGFDSATNSTSVRHVTRRLDHAAATLWEIQTSTGQPVLTTQGHRFLTTSGWKSADALKAGDQIATLDDLLKPSLATVSSVLRTDRKELVHNLHTTIDHTCIVAGYVAHNFAWFRPLRAWLHRLLIDPQFESVPEISPARTS